MIWGLTTLLIRVKLGPERAEFNFDHTQENGTKGRTGRSMSSNSRNRF